MNKSLFTGRDGETQKGGFLKSGECKHCHTVKTQVQFWHLWWCPLIKFMRVLD